jgi:hypothetical protein
MQKVRHKFRVGDWVTIVKIPSDLTDTARIGTPEVFKRAKGKTFCIEGFGRYGHVELVVTKRDTIGIEPEFLVRADQPRSKRKAPAGQRIRKPR